MRFTARQIILIVTLLLVGGGFRASTPFALGAEEDFLTDSEVDAVRDAQEPDKRLLLYLDIAQSRLEAARSLIAARKPGAGKAVQKRLAQYVKVLEALDETMQEAREKRAPLTKALAAIETRGTEFAKYLESLDDKSFGYDDYEFSLEEAREMTQDEIAEARKGDYPELKERKAPDLPSAPPRDAGKKSPGDEEGPPRKSRRP